MQSASLDAALRDGSTAVLVLGAAIQTFVEAAKFCVGHAAGTLRFTTGEFE